MSVVGSQAASFADDESVLDERVYVQHAVLASTAGLVVTLVSMVVVPGWLGATLAVAAGMFFCCRMLYRHPSPWLKNLVLFGLVAGCVELLADAWLVERTRTLVYASDGPFLFHSPLYMPVAWFGMLTAGLAFGMLLRREGWSVAATSALVALALGIYIPVYEALAVIAGWWRYQHCALLFGVVPVYIVLGEILIAIPLCAMAERLRRAGPGFAVIAGVGQGLWMFASYALAWLLAP